MNALLLAATCWFVGMASGIALTLAVEWGAYTALVRNMRL